MNVKNIIKQSVALAYQDFKDKPFDWTVYEIEAQVRLYNIIREFISDKMTINRKEPMPEFKEMKVDCLRLEYEMEDENGEKRKPDICIFRSDAKKMEFEDLYAFIEIKTAWGFSKEQFRGSGINKDFSLLEMYEDKGYLVYFIGNKFSSYKDNQRKEYEEAIKENIKRYNLNIDNIYIVFRDGIRNGRLEILQDQ